MISPLRSLGERIKLHILISICMFSHCISCAVLDSMRTSSLSGGLHQIVMENGWKPAELSFDPGSSLITGVNQTVEGVHGTAEDEKHDQQELDQAAAEEVVRNLSEIGYKLRVNRAKSSWRQSNIES